MFSNIAVGYYQYYSRPLPSIALLVHGIPEAEQTSNILSVLCTLTVVVIDVVSNNLQTTT